MSTESIMYRFYDTFFYLNVDDLIIKGTVPGKEFYRMSYWWGLNNWPPTVVHFFQTPQSRSIAQICYSIYVQYKWTCIHFCVIGREKQNTWPPLGLLVRSILLAYRFMINTNKKKERERETRNADSQKN